MSKSAGNVVAPQEVIEKHGAEILRLWIAATDFREDIRISQEILSHLIEAYRKIRNTSRFLLGNLYDYDPKRDAVPDEALEEIDRWALHRLQGLVRRVRRGYAGFEFHAVFHALNNFCAVDLSAIYLDILKDRLYSDPAGSPSRRAAQRVLFETLNVLTRLMAPILSFTAEEIWNQIPRRQRDHDSVHLASLPEEVKKVWMDKSLADHWENLLAVREEVTRTLEKERKEKKIGSSLEASVTLYAKGESWSAALDGSSGFPFYKLLEEKKGVLSSLFIVSQVDLLPWEKKPEGVPGTIIDGLAVQVLPARGTKCGRCWCYREDVGRNPAHPELCARCAEAVGLPAGQAG
jgi:isoleucyl-tRNA synthetase